MKIFLKQLLAVIRLLSPLKSHLCTLLLLPQNVLGTGQRLYGFQERKEKRWWYRCSYSQ